MTNSQIRRGDNLGEGKVGDMSLLSTHTRYIIYYYTLLPSFFP